MTTDEAQCKVGCAASKLKALSVAIFSIADRMDTDKRGELLGVQYFLDDHLIPELEAVADGLDCVNLNRAEKI